MTFKQLEQFLKTEMWRAGARRESELCGAYARCAYCDRFGDCPCARAYDTLMKKKSEGKVTVSNFRLPEPDVRGKFGTVFASEEEVKPVIIPPTVVGKITFATEKGGARQEDKRGSERIGVVSLKSHGNRGTRVLLIRRSANK